MEHETYREWLDLEADRALGEAERGELAAHVESCAECQNDRRSLLAVADRLRSAKVEVRAGFTAEVMAALEPAAWEARSLRAWRLPLAVLVLFAAGAALAWSLAGGSGGLAGGAWTAVAALAELVGAGLVAGSGLAAASWSGVGSAVAEWLGASPLRWIAALVAVGGLNYFALRLIRSRAEARVSDRDRS